MVDPRKYDGKSFKNPYLKSVAFEIRFPSNARIIKEYFKFQELINEKYPDYGEDFSFTGLPEELQPPETLRTISFINNDTKDTVKVSINKFIFISYDYEKFDPFKNEILRLFDILKGIFNIKTCQRIGLRYTNLYNLEKGFEDSKNKLLELFCPLYNPKKFTKEELFLHNIEIRRLMGDDIIISYRSQFQRNDNKKIFYHVLDFDTYIIKSFSTENCIDHLEKLHKVERDEFLLCVSDKFMDEMIPIIKT